MGTQRITSPLPACPPPQRREILAAAGVPKLGGIGRVAAAHATRTFVGAEGRKPTQILREEAEAAVNGAK